MLEVPHPGSSNETRPANDGRKFVYALSAALVFTAAGCAYPPALVAAAVSYGVAVRYGLRVPELNSPPTPK